MWKLEKLFWLRTLKIRSWSNTNWKSRHKDSRNIIEVSDPFFKEILEIWSEANYDENINCMSDYHLRSSPLWYNSLIRVENRPVFYKDWFLKGKTKVEHLMEDSRGKFLSLTTFQTMHDLTVRPLTFLGIISSIKLLQRYILHNNGISIKHKRFLTKFLKSKKPSRIVYKETCIRKKWITQPKSTKVEGRHYSYDKTRAQLERGLSNGFSMHKEPKTYNLQF